MEIHPYLYFDGNCQEAFEHYAELLGGDLEVMTYDQAPDGDDGPSKAWEDRVLNARLSLGSATLMGSDIPEWDDHRRPQGVRVTLQMDDPAEAERIYDALREEGTVDLELESTFWAKRFAMVTDRFGVPWLINCPK